MMERPIRDTTIKACGEREAIARLSARLHAGESVLTGIGDDCAVVAISGSDFDWLLTTDPIVESVHFLPDAPPEGIGHKAAGRVLSDIAACGGAPVWVLFNVVAPSDYSMTRLERIYDGADRLCARFGAAIIGGDLSRGERLELHAFAVGRVPRGTAVLRSGARPGDLLYVTGALGGSLRGRHLAFEPRIAEGQWLAAGRWATAMMDVSDGLASDLRRILEQSGVGAEIRLDAIPISDDARAMSRNEDEALRRALCDGEDFELLFAVPADRRTAFEQAWKTTFPLACTAVGGVTGEAGVFLVRHRDGSVCPYDRHGYEHFRD